jgi:hypothetical protein
MSGACCGSAFDLTHAMMAWNGMFYSIMRLC